MNNKDVGFKIDINDLYSSVDELLRNIKEDIIDIKQVPINEIIDQYLKYIIQNKNTIDLSIAGKTIAEIALILKIKSENLLPKLEVETSEEEDDEYNDFIISKEKEAYLQEYDKFQKVVKYLKEREGTQNNIYFPAIENNNKEDGVEIQKVDLADLLTSLDKVLQNTKKEDFIPFKKRTFTTASKMKEIINLLKDSKEGLSFDYFMESAQSKLEIIVIFLSLLELIYLRKIRCYQKKNFDRIMFNLKGDALKLKKNQETIQDGAI
ncbi:MAG: segregation/condensation protein A [Candidatus Caldatribacteriota bacterium]|nr:segregation/condensation protein A [Candidatus Caldatribacteriota bacterium]